MSRLIVKQLPAYLSEARLREHFAARGGAVTDVRLLRRPDGTSRGFAFVGFHSDADALEAQRYFDRTYIDTSKIAVEVARKIDDESLPDRRNKRSAPGADLPPSKRHAGESGVVASTPGAEASGSKPKPPKASKKGVSFDEFMSVMAPKAKRKTWQNEEGGEQAQLAAGDFAHGAAVADAAADRKVRKAERAARRAAKAEAAAAAAAAEEEQRIERDEPQPADAALNDEGMTDLDYMHRRMKRKLGGEEEKPALEDDDDAPKAFEQSGSEAGDDDVASSSDESDEDDDDAAAKREAERKRLEAEAAKEQESIDTIMTSGRLFVRNLPFGASEDELSEYFRRWGSVSQAHIPLDKKSKKAKGLAFVKFEEPANALAAFRAADGATFQGRLLHVMPAVDARPVPADAKAKTLKEQKKETLKADATKDFNWSMLYMSADAVASSVAERLGVDKSQILDANDDSGVSPAVKLALAETRVIQETKAFLSKEGLDLDVVQSGKRVARSDTTILVKNIPHGTTTEALRELFAKHGDVERVVMPPAGTLAIVEMPVAGEARVAFRSLAYKRIGNGVLYLEKAPVGLLKPKEEVELAAPSASTGAAAPPSKTEQMHGASAADNDDAEPGATLFVKNLSFATTDETLANFFAALPELAFARVQTRSDASKPGVRLSMGYGFAGFRSAAAAKAARQALDGHDLDGHSVSLAFAKRGQDEDKSKGKGAAAQTSSTKIVVKNLPFEANKKEVRALFAAYNVKSVRVPRKPAGGATAGARGFAFVEVATRRDAEAAMEALAHTHLLGRHLVLRYDKEDAQGVEGVRARTQRALPTGEETVARKAKLHLGEDDIRDAVARERAAADAADDDDDE